MSANNDLKAYEGTNRQCHSKSAIIEQIAQCAEFSFANFSKIYPEGLRKTLTRYRNQALQQYRQKIDDIIEAVWRLKQHESGTFAFVFSQNESQLEYIALTVRKFTNEQTREMFDYDIYTYSYEEPSPPPIREVEYGPQLGAHGQMDKFTGTSKGSKQTACHEARCGRDDRRSNQECYRESYHENVRENSYREVSTKEKIEALKACFINELASKGIRIKGLSN